jgi:hypothetical protein
MDKFFIIQILFRTFVTNLRIKNNFIKKIVLK